MIYLVSDRIDVSNVQDIQKLSVEDSLKMIPSWPVVQFDTETTGLDPHVCSLTAIQFGYKDFKNETDDQIVVDCKSIKPEIYKEVIESSHLIGHNLKFDLEFLFNHNIKPLSLYDTMICEMVLYLGYSKKQVAMNLGALIRRYTGLDVDKSFQKKIARSGLTLEGIRYAANDVKYLQDVRQSQLRIAQARACTKAFSVENRAVPAVAYLEWCGIHLDEERWQKKMDNDIIVWNKTKDELDQYIIHHEKLAGKFTAPYKQLDLFAPVDDKKVCSVNWKSNPQVVPVCQALGFNTKVYDKEKHAYKDSVQEEVLAAQKGIDDKFLQLYLDFKGADKTISSYGQNHLNLINPNTGRLHTKFSQIGAVTSRMSSGGEGSNIDLAILKKLPGNKVKYVNLQNLPARGEEGKVTRACFTAMPGNAFVSCDYSAEESRVQADVWEEKKLLDTFHEGLDMHSVYAKMCFPVELKDIDVRDVKNMRPDLRQAAKIPEFTLAYGGLGSTDEEREMIQNILKEMKGMASFKKKMVRFLKKNGYIVINPITGHRIYWPEWGSWRAVEDTFDRTFWDNYNMFHKGTNDAVCKKVRAHNEVSKEWFDKNVLNYPIQGGSAIILKQAIADLFEWIVRNDFFGKILFCVFVHDEIDCECPKPIAHRFAAVVQKIMENAAARYVTKLPIPAECSIETYWKH